MEIKKLIIVLTLFFSGFVTAQEYGVWFTHIGPEYHNPYAPPERGERVVFTIFVDNVKEHDAYYLNDDNEEVFLWRTTFTRRIGIHKKEDSNSPFKVDVFSSHIKNFPPNIIYTDEEMDLMKYKYYVGGSDGNVSIFTTLTSSDLADVKTFTFFSIVLPFYVQDIDNSRSKNDLLFLTPQNTFTDPVVKIPEIVWRYNYNGQGFKDFPDDLKHNFPMNSKVGDILRNELIENGKSFQIQATLDVTKLPADTVFAPRDLPFISTKIFNYYLINPSPEFHNVVKKDLKCDYTIDGGFKLNVKRSLNSGEELVITLYDTNNNALVGQEFTTSLSDNGDGTFGYNWIGNLDGGSYYLKFQSHNGTGGINPNDPSWSSLNSVGAFQVQKPSNVNFSVSNKSDQTCFQKNDGYIDLSASREPGRDLFFQLTKDGNIQVFNGTNWVNYTGTDSDSETFNSFTNETTTRINKLSKGDYRIKVRDSEKCYMK